MKKITALIVVLAVAVTVFAGAGAESSSSSANRIAMVTDSGDITDQSFNQTTYEACRDYANAHGIDFTYKKPAGDSDSDRIASIESAIDEGYNIIVTPGYLFGAAVGEIAATYPKVKFICPDVSEGDFNGKVPANVYSMIYREEVAGFMAGYAAVKLGYTKLGFLGGMAVPAVVRYGYGFVQGADYAAKETGKRVEMKYTYGGQFFGDSDITATMDVWYRLGTQVVFASGGGIYTSAAESAAKVGAKVIGVDVDQAPIIDGAYGKGITVTSAMKGLRASVQDALKKICEEGTWASVAGKSVNLGLVSKDPEENYVGIPTGAGTQFSSSFSIEDYKALIADMLSGKIKVDNSIDVAPSDMAKNFKVLDYGNIK